MNPFFSIIIPVFDRANILHGTLDTIKSEFFYNWECLLVDDGSAESEKECIRELISKDERFKLIRRDREPKGASTCRNIGVENAKGDYLIFFDSDDLFLPAALEERAIAVNTNPDCDFLVFSCAFMIDGQQDLNLIVNRQPANEKDTYLKMFLRYELPWNIMCPVWKRSFIEKLGRFNENFERFQDVEFHTRALVLTDNFKVFNKVDCLYRVDENNKSRYSDVTFIEKLVRSYTEYIKMVSSISFVRSDKELYKNLSYGFNFLFRSFFLKLPLDKNPELNVLFTEAYSRNVIPQSTFFAYSIIRMKAINSLFDNKVFRKIILKLFFPVSGTRKNITSR